MDATAPVRSGLVSAPIVIRGGGQLGAFVAAAERIVHADVGRIAVVGGVAVTCRLASVHRATGDVDTVAEYRTPAVVDVLSDLEGAEASDRADRVIVDGVPVDVIETEPIDDVEGIDGDELLFVLSHRFALDTAVSEHVIVDGEHRTEGDLPLATAAGLVAMKLGAYGSRPRRSSEKRPTDAYDVYRLLADLDDDGDVAAAILAEPALREAVRPAAQHILVDDATRTLKEIRKIGDAVTAGLTVDDITFVGERFVDRL